MVKILCLTLGSLGSNKYVGISGKEYMFHQSGATVIDNREDAETFLKSNNGEAFKKVNKVGEYVESLKDALAEVAKELPGKKKEKKEEDKVDMATNEQKELINKRLKQLGKNWEEEDYKKLTKEKAEEEITKLENEMKEIEENKTTEELPEAPADTTTTEDDNEETVYDFASLKALNKKDQVIMLRKLDGDDTTIPAFENGRIEKILELQKNRGEI